MMKKGGAGGAQTGTGLRFERQRDLLALLQDIEGYAVRNLAGMAGEEVFFHGDLVARCLRKNVFYKYLEEEDIEWEQRVSKRLFPDDAIIVMSSRKLFIIEVKYQQVAGSVDEKLQTCDFKRKQYSKLVSDTGLTVEYVYVLNDWFRKPEYRDVLGYIRSVGCRYVFGELPLSLLGLPVPD